MRHLSRETYSEAQIISAHLAAIPETTGASPLLFYNKCPGFFYVHYTTHGTYSFTSHPKDEAIMVKCLAQGHKRRDTRVQHTRPLGLLSSFNKQIVNK